MYLGMNDGSGMLLDVGEGTLGQLIRSWRSTYKGDDECAQIRRKMRMVKPQRKKENSQVKPKRQLKKFFLRRDCLRRLSVNNQ